MNSFISTSKSSKFEFFGVGQNLKPFKSKDFSKLVRLYFEILIILGTIFCKLLFEGNWSFTFASNVLGFDRTPNENSGYCNDNVDHFFL